MEDFRIPELPLWQGEITPDKRGILYDPQTDITYQLDLSKIKGSGGDAAPYSRDIKVFLPLGHTFGIYKNLDIIPAMGKTPAEVIEMAVNQVQPVSYTQPSATHTGTPGPDGLEVGQMFALTIDGTFAEGDSGGATGAKVFKDGVEAAQAEPHTFAGFQVTETPQRFKVGYSYAAGPVKLNDAGEPDPAGKIEAGYVESPESTYLGYRNAFSGGVSNEAAAVDSSTARALPIYTLNPQNGTAWDIAIPAGADRVEIAYPATLRDLAQVKYVEDSNKIITGNYVRQADLQVTGRNGLSPITYKRYSFVPVEPFPSAVTHNINI